MPKTQIDRRRHRKKPAQNPAFQQSRDEDHPSPENSDSSLNSDAEEEPVVKENELKDASSEEEEEDDFEEPDNPDDEDFEEQQESSSDDEDEEEFSREYTPARRKRAAPTRRSRTTRSSYRDESSSEEEVQRPTRSRRGRAKTSYREVDSEDEEEEEETSTRRSTPSRASAKRASKKLHETLEQSEDDDGEGFALIPKKKKRRKKPDSDSEDFVADENSDEEEEDDEDLSVEDEEGVLGDNVQNVDNESFCSKDDSSDDDLDRSPTLNIRRRQRKRTVDNSDDDASLSEFQTTPGESDGQQRSPLKLSCPSTHDVITMDPLPDKHVCFVTPDGQSRQCFALETLHTIAMTSQNALVNGKRTFMQPPHFRSSISDDLIDQIASRFGRAALDLDGYFYNRNKLPSSQSSEEIDYLVNFGGSLADTEEFRERFDNYISNLMGHQDVYCCPLCYTEAYRSLTHPDESGDDDSDQEDAEEEEEEGGGFVFSQDPMTILGSLDSDKFQLAAGFCFTKVAQVKRHLRDEHNIDTSVLDGNGLFKRFKIRESDGLLQRYIDTCHFLAYQGSMSRYWHEGYNLMFLQMLQLMNRTQVIKANPETADADERMILDDAEVFLESFRKRARRVWEKLSAPYRKMSKKELDDFIANGDEEEEDAGPMFNHSHVGEVEMTPEEQIVAALKERRRSRGEASEEEEEEQEESSHDEEDNDSGSDYSEGSEDADSESEEEDEWVEKRRPKASKARGKRVGAKRKASHVSPAPVDAIPTSSTKQRRHIVLSDDED